MKRVGLILCFVCSAVMAAQKPVHFTSRPAAKQDGKSVTIQFAISEPTDVAVYVLDAQGKVVRHLAAGVLGGKNPPPEPLKPGLTQSIGWDGKDDSGRTGFRGAVQRPGLHGTEARVRPDHRPRSGLRDRRDEHESDCRIRRWPDGTLYVHHHP